MDSELDFEYEISIELRLRDRTRVMIEDRNKRDDSTKLVRQQSTIVEGMLRQKDVILLGRIIADLENLLRKP